MTRHKYGELLAAALMTIVAAAPALAAKHDIRIDNTAVSATPVEQPDPAFPGSGIRRGQEGWVRVNFVITPEGNTVDPIVVDSSGGGGFEASAREAVSQWRFEASGEELANNTADIRFENTRGRERATTDFMRRYRNIVMHLHYEENEKARKALDQALGFGGWNLYESTMLWLMAGRVEGAEGNAAGKLEKYRRALGVSDRESLNGEVRRDLLIKLFEMEMDHSQYASAQQTLQLLQGEPGSKQSLAGLQDKIIEMERMLATGEPIAAKATLFSRAGSGDGEPLWTYKPFRRTFSFAALSGNVERFEMRCDRDRLQGLVEVGKSWSIPADSGNCQVFVFGDDGASFEFVEHVETKINDATGPSTVARSDGLD